MKRFDSRRIFAALLCLFLLCSFTSCLGGVSTKTVTADKEAENYNEETGKYDPVTVPEGEEGKTELFVEDKDKDEEFGGSAKNENEKGFTYYVMTPVGKLLAVINDFLNSYILSLFVFAVLVKILLFWFSYKQQKSMVKQAYFKPKERAIRNKYKGRTDQATVQKMNQEIMEAQQKEGVSMFGGCLPLLIQMPIIMLLYEVIRNPLRYVSGYTTSTVNALRNVLSYNDVSDMVLSDSVRKLCEAGNGSSISELDLVAVLRDNWDKFDFSKIVGMSDHINEAGALKLPNFYMIGNHVDLSVTPSITFEWPEVLYLLIPIVTFLALFFSMKINRKLTGAATAPAGGDENMPDMSMANGMMDLMMPAMSTVITFMVPSVLGVYWIFNNLLGTAQQFILKKMVPFPVFTEEDYKQAEREYNKGKDVKKKKKTEEGEEKPENPAKPKVKSLHHIDDEEEDYPVLPPLKEGPVKSAEDEKAKKKKGKVDKASMKKEDEKDKK